MPLFSLLKCKLLNLKSLSAMSYWISPASRFTVGHYIIHISIHPIKSVLSWNMTIPSQCIILQQQHSPLCVFVSIPQNICSLALNFSYVCPITVQDCIFCTQWPRFTVTSCNNSKYVTQKSEHLTFIFFSANFIKLWILLPALTFIRTAVSSTHCMLTWSSSSFTSPFS